MKPLGEDIVLHQETHFPARDGTNLYEQYWLPDGPPQAVVVIVHGINEHSGRYARLAADLTGRGYAVYAMDLRGHGRSDGERVMVRSFDEYLDDVEDLLQRVAEREPGKTLFLLGHSMGGGNRRAADDRAATEHSRADPQFARPEHRRQRVSRFAQVGCVL